MQRRNFLFGAITTSLSAFFGLTAANTTSPAAISKKAAREQFLMIMDFWKSGSLTEFFAYGDVEIELEGQLLSSDEISALFHEYGPSPNDRNPIPARLHSFEQLKSGQSFLMFNTAKISAYALSRLQNADQDAVYAATVEHERWVDNLCVPSSFDDTGEAICTGEPGHQFRLSGWYVIFENAKIKRLVNLGSLA